MCCRCVSDTLGVAETRGQKSDARDACHGPRTGPHVAPMAANVFRQVRASQRDLNPAHPASAGEASPSAAGLRLQPCQNRAKFRTGPPRAPPMIHSPSNPGGAQASAHATTDPYPFATGALA